MESGRAYKNPPHYSIFVIHPYRDDVGFVQSNSIQLDSNEEYTLNAGVSDVRNDCSEASDVGFRVKVKAANENWTTLTDEIVEFSEGWQDLSYDISQFAGKEVTVRIESYAGGEKEWCSEWAAVDYLYIKNSEGEIISPNPHLNNGWKHVEENLSKRKNNPYLVFDFAGYGEKIQSFSDYFENFSSGMHVYNPISRSLPKISKIYEKASKAASSENVKFFATVIPGYNDTEIRSPGFKVERENGNYYNSIWKIAKKSNPDYYLITSFNEWHEGTEIEPSLEYGYRYINLTAEQITSEENYSLTNPVTSYARKKDIPSSICEKLSPLDNDLTLDQNEEKLIDEFSDLAYGTATTQEVISRISSAVEDEEIQDSELRYFSNLVFLEDFEEKRDLQKWDFHFGEYGTGEGGKLGYSE